MRHRPLVLAAAVYAAFLLVLTLIRPGFPLDSRAVRTLRAWEESGDDVTVEGVVTASRVTASGHQEVTLRKAVVRSGERRVRVKSLRLYTDEPAFIGRRLLAEGQLSVSRFPTVPGQFNTYLYDRLRGCPFRLTDAGVTRVSAGPHGVAGRLAVLREAAILRLERVFPQPAAGFLSAVLFGERAGMSEEETQLWRQAGAAHILAISGLHLTLIGMGLFSLLRKLRLSLTASALLAGGALALYALMTGLSVPTLRALIMFLYAIGARLLGRPPDRPTAVALASLLILLEDPAYLLDAGFQLSFAAVAVLALPGDEGRYMTAARLFFIPLPLILWHYFELPLFGLLVNLVLIPLMPALLLFGAAGLALGGVAVYPATGLLFLIERGLGALGTLAPLTFITGRPALCQIGVYEGLLAGLLFLLHRDRRKRRRFLYLLSLPLLVILLIRRPSKDFELTMLDVGQGDGFVLETPDRRTLIVDGGSSSVDRVGRDRLIPYLKYEGIRRVDYLFVTHMDEDHISGVVELLEAIKERRTSLRVETFVLPYRSWAGDPADGRYDEEASAMETYRKLAHLAEEAGARLFVMAKGDSLRVPAKSPDTCALYVEVLGPDPALAYKSENAASLILSVSYGAFDVLMTGDIVDEGEAALSETLKAAEDDRSYELLKAAHHGSKYSTPETFLDLVSPQAALISCGYHNLYGHPHRELLKRLTSREIAVSRTDRDGTVRVATDGRIYLIRSYISGIVSEERH